MNLISRIALSLAAAGPASVAAAADYDPPIFVEDAIEVPVEIGSGWYLRGDVTYSANRDYRDTSLFVSDPFEEVLPFPLLVLSEDEETIAGSVGAGYQFTEFLRADLNLGFLPSEESSATAFDASLTASNKSWTLMANGYIDLGTYVGITPYIGAGVGVIQTDNELRASFGALSAAYSNEEYNFMYSLNAGLAYKVSTNTSVDLGYQYVSAPDAPFVSAGLDAPVFRRGVDYHQVKLGLRYEIW